MTKWIQGALALSIATLVGGIGTSPVAAQGGASAGAPRAERVPDRAGPHRFVFDTGGGRIGIEVRDLNRADADRAKLPEPTGAYVDEVETGSPAEKAGIRKGDVVVEFDGERVRSARQLTRLVRETPAGRTVHVTIVRNGAREPLTLAPERVDRWLGTDMDEAMARADRKLRALPRALDMQRMMPPDMWSGGAPPMEPIWGSRLGVVVVPMTDQLAGYFGAKSGVLVSDVKAGSPAAKAGLRAGDVVTSIDGRPIDDPGDLVRNVRRATGTDLSIGVVRDRKPLTLQAAIGER